MRTAYVAPVRTGQRPTMFGVDHPPTEAAVRAYVKLMRAGRSVLARIEPPLAKCGLTPTQLGALEALLHKGPMTHRELGRKVLTSAGNLTDVVDKLGARGLVERVRDEADRRLVRVALTDTGRALIERVFPPHAGDIARAMSGLNPDELAELDRLLRKLGHAARAGLADPSSAPHLPAEPFDIERHPQETEP